MNRKNLANYVLPFAIMLELGGNEVNAGNNQNYRLLSPLEMSTRTIEENRGDYQLPDPQWVTERFRSGEISGYDARRMLNSFGIFGCMTFRDNLEKVESFSESISSNLEQILNEDGFRRISEGDGFSWYINGELVDTIYEKEDPTTGVVRVELPFFSCPDTEFVQQIYDEVYRGMNWEEVHRYGVEKRRQILGNSE